MNILHMRKGGTREVKNLGWLLRNHNRVDRFEAVREGSEGYLRADMKAGDTVHYAEFSFAHWAILLDFLARPVFMGRPVMLKDDAWQVFCHVGDMRYEIQRQNPYMVLYVTGQGQRREK